MTNRIFFFTNSYPFGFRESFIENEIPFLAEYYDEVFIIPLYKYGNDTQRPIPDNCILLRPIIRSRLQHYLKGIFCFRTIKGYLVEFFSKAVYRKISWIKAFFIDSCTTNCLVKSVAIRRIFSNLEKDDILYFYWGKGVVNILPFLPHIRAKKVVRFHRADLYKQEQGGYIPLQELILQNADVAVFISKHGHEYFRREYPEIFTLSKVSYLGTMDIGVSKKSTDGVLRILSCSGVIPVKRLFLLYEGLQLIEDLRIEWTHIGSGVGFGDLNDLVKFTNPNISINLIGQLSNKDVHQYYMKNIVDLFVNVSASEGLPVSLMEAISFDVPVIGTDVGGTSDLVTRETGVLLRSNPSAQEIAMAISSFPNNGFAPKLFWSQMFNAKTNYPKFICDVLLK